MKIYARQCVVRDLEYSLYSKFMEKYHIQGSVLCNIRLGLFYKNRLVAVMSFSKLRKALGNSSKEGHYELLRFATLGSFSIIGAAGKLLSHFEKNYKPISILSYADLRWSDGNLYEQLGFTKIGSSKPNYWYFDIFEKDKVFKHRFNFRKDKLKSLFPDLYDDNKSEWEIMKEAGYDRVWDCGNLIFRKNYEN